MMVLDQYTIKVMVPAPRSMADCDELDRHVAAVMPMRDELEALARRWVKARLPADAQAKVSVE